MVDVISILTLTTVGLGFLFVGLAIGSAISRVNGLAYAGIALLVGALLWLGAIIFSSTLASFSYFTSYVALYEQFASGLYVFGNPDLSVVFGLIGLLEIGMISGYGIGRFARTRLNLRRRQVAIQGPPHVQPLYGVGDTNELNDLASVFRPVDPSVQNSPLDPDERIVAQLLLFGGISEAKPKLNDKRPEGYEYEQLRNLEWDTKKEVLVLTSLARRKLVCPYPAEKILHCKNCGATGLEYRAVCPECGSLALSKNKVLEHFSCGMIEKEVAFRTPEGDLVCPKCNKKLELIGNDYRSLGLMYVCQNCGALSKELNSRLKCKACSFTASPEEEKEETVYGFSVDQNALSRIRQLVKPIEIVVDHYKSMGYTVNAPSFVRGHSGIEHTFDLMIQKPVVGPAQIERETLIEILASNKPIELDDVTRDYGKISDVQYSTVVLVVPSLTERARDYASAYRMTVYEGKDIRESLLNADKILAPSELGRVQSSRASFTL
jgi:predicted RNA-binding Zn-ribbon protein involved in translation (DUF1610 family)